MAAMQTASPFFARALPVLCALLSLLAAPRAAPARYEEPPGLVTVVVRVLDATGTPASGIEVELSVTRADGTRDRRLGESGADGRAAFADVRADCIDILAAALLGPERFVSGPRDCSEDPELFIVLTPSDPEPPPAEVIDEEPEPEPEPESEPEPEPEPEPGRISLAARAGIGLCQEWFYRPGPEDLSCADDVSPGLDLEIDGGWHLTEWLAIGPRLGYGFFRSTVTIVIGDDSADDSQTQLIPDEEVEVDIDGAHHRLHWGLGVRASWEWRRLIAGVDLMPLALLHQFTRVEGGDNRSLTEFVVSFGVLAGVRVGRSSWIGGAVRFFQPLPWVEGDRFLPGTLAANLVFGHRFARLGASGSRRADAEERVEAEPEDPDLDRRGRFIELQQERTGF